MENGLRMSSAKIKCKCSCKEFSLIRMQLYFIFHRAYALCFLAAPQAKKTALRASGPRPQLYGSQEITPRTINELKQTPAAKLLTVHARQSSINSRTGNQILLPCNLIGSMGLSFSARTKSDTRNAVASHDGNAVG